MIPVHKNEHLCQIFKTKSVECDDKSVPTPKLKLSVPQPPFSKLVKVDPDLQFSLETRSYFEAENLKYDELFAPTIGRYNDASGKVRARVNLGKVYPTDKKVAGSTV